MAGKDATREIKVAGKYTIYDAMAHKRMDVACRQINVLNYYDEGNRTRRIERVYVAAHKAFISEPSEKSLECMDAVIKEFDKEIKKYRRTAPEIEQREERVGRILRTIDRLLAARKV